MVNISGDAGPIVGLGDLFSNLKDSVFLFSQQGISKNKFSQSKMTCDFSALTLVLNQSSLCLCAVTQRTLSLQAPQ